MESMSAENALEIDEPDKDRRETNITLAPVDFQPPFLLRLGAALIDYIILLILPLTGLLSDKLVGGDGFGVFTDRTIWFIAVIFSACNVILLPLLRGQSFGKMLTGIRIVRNDGNPASRWAILVRQTLGYVLTLATFGLGFFISALNGSGRTLHDFITGTVTVRAIRRMV